MLSLDGKYWDLQKSFHAFFAPALTVFIYYIFDGNLKIQYGIKIDYFNSLRYGRKQYLDTKIKDLACLESKL